MTPERWQQVKSTVAAALEQSNANERAAFVARACADDTALRREVESLLAQPEDDFEVIGQTIGVAQPDRFPASDEGRRIGNYELIRELGRGGMGAVWLARRADRQFEKLVAIKLLKRGTDTDEVLRRFQTERQILARLEHPNIARLLDGGITDDDLPYFVMEYVEGQPVTDYCHERSLTIEERLRLFLKICRAVQFAHQNLVVHRDLKPGNILVASDGEPKLLDFGIAKLLGPAAGGIDVTIADHQRLTPAYASPEQVRAEPITTVSDVYALGTLLYEIVTGKSAHRFSVPHPAPTELFRVVTQEEPVRPSAAATETSTKRRLRGDLDNIILKALRKEPSRRYSGVGAFAEDIRRHLEHLPVIARKDTLSYRAVKFVQRNKIGVAAASFVILALVGGIIATSREARIATTERQRAEKRFNDVHNLASALLTEINNEAEKVPGSTKLRSLLVQRTPSYLDSVVNESGNNRALQQELATAYQKVGDIQGNTYFSNLGDIPGAIASYEKAVAIRESLAKAAGENTEARHELALAHEGYADVLWGANRLSDTLLHYREAQTILKALVDESKENKAIRYDLSRVYHKMGDLYGNVDYSNLGDTATGVANHAESLRLREALAREEPSNHRFLDVVSESYVDLGTMERIIGDLAGAVQNCHAAITIQEKFRAAEPGNPIFRRHIAIIQRRLAVALQEDGRIDEALEAQQSALRVAEQQADADQKNSQAKRNLAVSECGLALLLARKGDVSFALEYYRKATDILEKLFSESSSNALVRRDLFVAYLGSGDTYMLGHNSAAAKQCYQKAKTTFESASDEKLNTQARSDLAALSFSLGAWERDYGSLSAALEEQRRSMAIREELLAANPSNAISRRDLALTYSELAATYKKLARDGHVPTADIATAQRAAEEYYRKSLKLWQDMEERKILGGTYATKPAEVAEALANLRRE